ncbi:MAG: hypothetical protein R3C68_03390 [Myxococcota bacterium]
MTLQANLGVRPFQVVNDFSRGTTDTDGLNMTRGTRYPIVAAPQDIKVAYKTVSSNPTMPLSLKVPGRPSATLTSITPKESQDALDAVKPPWADVIRKMLNAIADRPDDTAQRLGFESREEARNAIIEPGFHSNFVGLDTVEAFKPGNDPKALLQRSPGVLVPLSVEEDGVRHIRSEIWVMPSDKLGEEGQYRVGQMGGGSRARALSHARDEINALHPDSSCFIVHVAAMSQMFVGTVVSGVLMLKLIRDLPPGMQGEPPRFRTGAFAPAHDVFVELSKTASRHRLPPFRPQR